MNQKQKHIIQHSGVGMKEKQKNTRGLSSLLVHIRVKPETTFIFTQGVSLSFRQADFGHDMNKK